ncbi:hypothetical protein G9A89_005299 [Geosiphon pyriformis]|nr:hypothetical protein G9A89_005299 [Geosiphon pyriformis]
MAPRQLFHALSHDFESLLNSLNFSDIRIIFGEASNTRTVYVHSQILAARSSYFAIALSGDWVKRENNTIVFSKPNISPDIFELILRYIYSGEISLNEHGPLTILELFIAADELILEKLIDHLEDYLIEHHVKELEENFATFHETSFIHHSFKKLQKVCIEIAVNNSSAVFNSQNFTSLNRNVLCSILSWDDRNMEENENFEAFKESIEELLPLIRYFNISSVDFYHKVKPFARILPGILYEDLLQHYLVPGSHQESMDAQPLHQLGNDNKGSKITVIKVKWTGQLIGGYNPESWHSRWDWIDGKESFIFSLGDGKAQNAKLSNLVSKNGPFCHKELGPQFGYDSIRTYSHNFQSIPCSCIKETNYEHVIMPGSENTANALLLFE